MIYKNFKHSLLNLEFLQFLQKESLVIKEDFLNVSLSLKANQLMQLSTERPKSIKLTHDKITNSINNIQLKPASENDKIIEEIPIFYDRMNQEQKILFVCDKRKSPIISGDDLTSQILDYHYFSLYMHQDVSLVHEHYKVPIKITPLDYSFQFVQTDLFRALINDNKAQFGYLGFDQQYRILVYGQSSNYPVVGFWQKGVDLTQTFLQNKASDKLKQQLWLMMMKFIRAADVEKVTFSQQKIKFLFIPFANKGQSPPIMLVEMGNKKDEISQEISSLNDKIDESIPIQSSLQVKSKKLSKNMKLWENFLNKQSLVDNGSKLDDLEQRMEKLAQEYDNILKELQKKQKMFNTSGEFILDEYLKSESDIQNSNYPQQFMRLLQQHSSKQLFTGRSSKQKNHIKVFNGNTRQSSFKKLNNSIYDTLDYNRFLGSEDRVPGEHLQQHDVSSFFTDLPQIKTTQ